MIYSNNLWRIILFFIFFPLKTLILSLLLLFFGINSIPAVFAQFLSLLFAIIILTILFKLYKKDSLNSLFKKGFRIKHLPIFILVAFLIRLPILPLLFGLLNNNSDKVLESQWPTQSVAGGIASRIEYIILIINVVILTPLLEEVFHRGIVFNYLKNKFSPVLTILFSGFLFALVHGNILLIASSFIPGLIFSYIYYKTDDIKYPILLHSLVNLFPFIFPYVLLFLNRL